MTSEFTPPAPLETAVLFLVFNRPDTTARVFEAIRQAQPPRLYVAADGPRDGREGEAERVAEVREIATAVDWPCELFTFFRENNRGCGPAVNESITWFLNKEEEGIILEDDTVPEVSFFYFCDQLLIRYRYDDRIGMVAGTNHINYQPDSASYLFSKNKACWGWATWRRAWHNMDHSLQWRHTYQSGDVIQNMGVSGIHKSHWRSALESIDKGRVNAWDWHWYFSLSSQNQLTIFPSVNLVSNIGFGAEATHTGGRGRKEFRQTGELMFPLVHPILICPDREYDEKFERVKFKKKSKFRAYVPEPIKIVVKFVLDQLFSRP